MSNGEIPERKRGGEMKGVVESRYTSGERPVREPKTMEEWAKFVREDFMGKEVPGERDLPLVTQGVTAIDFRNYALGIGDDNPLYTDPAYAAKTRWAGPIAPPTFPMTIRYTGTPDVAFPKGIMVTSMNGGVEIYNYDVIRPGDRFRSEKKVSDVVLKKGGRVGAMPIVYCRVPIWNQRDELVAKEVGWSLHPQIAMNGGAKLLQPRSIYQYSAVDREKIIHDIESEPPRRGSKTLYWEDVKVGEKLPTKVSGPLTFGDFMTTSTGTSLEPGTNFELTYFTTKQTWIHDTGHKTPHPEMNWDYLAVMEHIDPFVCLNRGIPLPFDFGVARSAMSYTYLTDWMGDDGWVFRLKTAMREVFLIGDNLWVTGEVVNKEKTKEGAAVGIKFALTNQLGAVVSPGEATVLLPSRIDGPVKLPVPQPITPIPHETPTPMEL
ncbi:hypothetical protein ES703_75472 [subsurface metagenome]